MLKNSLIYLMSNILNKAIPFLMLPIVTRYLGPAEFGKWSIYLVIMQFADAVIGMNLETNITRNYFSKPKETIRLYFGNVIYALMMNVAVGMCILIVLKDVFFRRFELSFLELSFMLPFAFLETLSSLYLCYLRNERKAIQYGIYQITKTFLYFAFCILCLAILGWGWHGQLAGSILSVFLMATFATFRLYQLGWIRMKFSKELTKEIYSISLPLVFYAASFLIINLSDRLFVQHYVGLYAVGIYSLANSLSTFVNLYTDSFCKAWSPWFYEKMAKTFVKNTIDPQIKKGLAGYLLSLASVSFCGVLVLYFVTPLIFPAKYNESVQYLPVLVTGLVFQGLHKILQPFFVFLGKTRAISTVFFIVSLVNIALNFLWIPPYKIWGAAYATLISYILHAVLATFVLKWIIGKQETKVMMTSEKIL